jgi:hypothetical protein
VIRYVAERVTISAALLGAWSASVAGTTLNLTGPCPACGDDAPNSVPLQVTALEAMTAQTSRTLTVALRCTCDRPHPDRPADVSRGCGRNWSILATSSAGGQVSLSAPVDPTLVTAAEALRDAAPRQLGDLRSAAEKWIAGITALYGLFGLSGVVITRDSVAKMSTAWQIAIAVSALAALALAAWSIYWIYRAAYGWPKVRSVRDDDELRTWYAAQLAAPAASAALLRTGVRTAGASLAALTLAVGLLWFAPMATSATPLIQATLENGSQVCGTLLPVTDGRVASIRSSADGTVVIIPLSQIAGLTSVASC